MSSWIMYALKYFKKDEGGTQRLYIAEMFLKNLFSKNSLCLSKYVEEKTLKATFIYIRMGMHNGVLSPQVLDSAPGPDL